MDTKSIFIVIGVIIVGILIGFVVATSRTNDNQSEVSVTDNNEMVDEGEGTIEVFEENAEEVPQQTEEEPKSTTPAPSPAPKPTPTPSPKPTPTPAPPGPSLPYNITVTYDGDRFFPEEATIIEGGTVKFVNLSDEVSMWVASNHHPTHSLYPLKSEDNCIGSDFDQCEAMGLGGTWFFTFERFGTFQYHNHKKPKDIGEIRVTTVEDYLKTI